MVSQPFTNQSCRHRSAATHPTVQFAGAARSCHDDQTRTRRCLPACLIVWISALVAVCSAPGVSGRTSASELTGEARTSVLVLTNGDHVAGRLVPSPKVDCLGWQSPAFVAPFQFQLEGLESIHFSAPAALPEPTGSYGLELADGDLLFGSLIGLDATVAVWDLPDKTRLNIDRAIMKRLYRRGAGSDVLFVGPNGLNGWETPGEAGLWREDAGHLTSDKPGAVLRRDFKLPNQSRLEFELSWTNQPDFELAIGVDDNSKTVSRAYRFDVWENELVIQREAEREANVESLQKLAKSSGRIHVQAFLDQILGRMLVYSSSGKPLADLTVMTAKPQVFGGIQLTNRRGDIRLERLQIGRWNGEVPRKVEADKSRIHLIDGTITYGNLTSFDAEKREFAIGDEAATQTIAEDKVQDVFLSQPGELAPRSLRAVYLTGMKISGDLMRIEDQTIWLKSPGIQEPVQVPLDALQSLVILRAKSEHPESKSKSETPESPQRRGRFEISGATLQGYLIDGKEGDTSCLVWQPVQSSTASAIQRGVSAQIVYRELPKPPAQTAQQQLRQQAQPGTAAQRPVRKVVPPKSTSKAESILHLRTGDKIPCEATSIDEQGLTFKSSVSEATFVPHHQIHALELLPNEPPVPIENKKRERLLTLPRMQRNNPPTHLFRSVDGDYLRGRLESMNEDQVKVELRLEGRIIPRDRVARIIWLHPESLTTPADASNDSAGFPTKNLVQTLQRPAESSGSKAHTDGNRLTFAPEQVEGGVLSGRSELFGICHVELTQVDQLLIGGAIEQAAANLPFGSWKLKQSADPLGPKDGSDGAGDGSEGLESALVAKPAPAISLQTLDGKKFQLSDHLGKIVILDFWASWCGPCLQAMPQVDKVAEEFADQGVVLFAINLEETPDKVNAALERLKLSPTVLLDRDGRIAEKYGATSIPQTVIIDREGKVARLYVGTSARFDEQLRTGLKGVLSAEQPKSE